MSTSTAPREAMWNARRKIKTEQPYLNFIENTGPTKFNLTLKANVMILVNCQFRAIRKLEHWIRSVKERKYACGT